MSRYQDISRKNSNLTDAGAILQSVQNILFINKGERLFDRSFGSHLESYLFSPMTFTTSRLIYMDIVEALSRDPRLTLLNSSTVTMDKDNRVYKIHLEFEVAGLANVVTMDQDLQVHYYDTVK